MGLLAYNANSSEICRNLEFTLNPEVIMIDFEIAAKKAFEITFPRWIVKGCAFHFGQSLFKKLCEIGLKQEYLFLSSTFVNYLKKKYFNSSARFVKSMWNHSDNPDEPTNNIIEGDNLRWRIFVEQQTLK